MTHEEMCCNPKELLEFSSLYTEIWGTWNGMEIKGVEQWWKEHKIGLGSRSRDSAFNVALGELERALANWFVGWRMDQKVAYNE